MTAAQGVEAIFADMRRKAGEEAERFLREAQERLKARPEAWGELEKQLRSRMLALGGSIWEAAASLAGNGYEGSRRVCECGGTQKYMNDRERDAVGLLGRFRLKRAYYWCPNCRKGRAPLDHRLGIEGSDFTEGVREMIGRVGAEVALDRGRALMGQLSGIWVSKRKHEEIAEAIGAGFSVEAPPRSLPAGTVDDLYLSCDGTIAPTLEGWRKVKIGAVFHAQPDSAGDPQRGTTRYFGDVVEAETFGWRWYRWASAMGLERAKRIVLLGDGAAWIWTLAELHFPGAVQIVDWYHASERLWIVANAALGEGKPKARAWGKDSERLLRAGRIEEVLRRIARLRPASPDAQEILREAQGYFRNNAARMRYHRFRRRGLFIGSGVVEAGCKHIVGARFKQSGMRWSLPGLRSILQLRLALLNGDWPSPAAKAA
jgi:hypothetical protein